MTFFLLFLLLIHLREMRIYDWPGWLFVAAKLPAWDANASSFQGGRNIGSDVYRGIFWRILFIFSVKKEELYTLVLFLFLFFFFFLF